MATLTERMMKREAYLASNVKNLNASYYKVKLPSCKRFMRP